MDAGFLNALSIVAIAALFQMTPSAHMFGVVPNFALVIAILSVFRARSWSECAVYAVCPALIFGSYVGMAPYAAALFVVVMVAYAARRLVSWQSWFAYHFFIACGTVGLYGLANHAFVSGSVALLAREAVLNIIFGAIVYASAARFRFFEV